MSTPLAANTVDAAALADELARFRVLPADRLTGLLAEFPGDGPAALAEFLVARGALTPFQADRALAGEARSLLVGPYRLVGVHGPGLLGPTFRAEKTGRAGPAAFTVRVLPLRSLWQARQAKQLVRTLATLPPHPGLVPLVDADSANGFHYLVWPLTHGQLLGDRVGESGPLPPDQTAGLLARLADALGACHARHIVHGLLTPAAVALGDVLPRLLELGAGTLLAQNLAAEESLLDTLTFATSLAGLLDFAAPELVLDPTRPTPATDQYGLGAIGFYALTGLSPAREQDLPSVREVSPEVPADIAAVIDRMLRPDPADRFPGVDEVRQRLARIAGEALPVAPGFVVPASRPEMIEGPRAPAPTSWVASGSGVGRPPERDDTDASVRFDLPEPKAEAPVEPPRSAPPVSGEARLVTVGPTARPPRPSGDREKPAPPPKPPEPEVTVPTPVRWHTGEPDPTADSGEEEPQAGQSQLWKRVRRNLLFWQAPTDPVQVSVFGPPDVTPGKPARVTVFLHPPAAAESVRTLARAFHHDAELLATGHLAREVARRAELTVHLGATNAGVSQSILSFTWRGQPRRLNFELHVPWESPAGPAPGMVSVGQDNVRLGKVEFRLHVLPRKA